MNKNTQQIYVRLIDGTEVFVPVIAAPLSGELFEVLEISGFTSFDSADYTSIWEFFPGDIVRCQQHTFTDGGSGLLAHELISSTFPNRKLHELIFLIVYSQGEVTIKKLKGFEQEIGQLCRSHAMLQKLSVMPAVADWAKRYCNIANKDA